MSDATDNSANSPTVRTATLPPFVAHRGDPYRHPENTLTGALSAIDLGSRYFEIDIQLSSDLVPVLYHDGELQRLSAATGEICKTRLSELQRFGAFHPERFGQQHRGTPIATLRQLLSRIKDHQPNQSNDHQAQAFIELKLESLAHFGRAVVLDQVLPLIAEFGDSVAAVISKDDDAIELARERVGCAIGWVLPEWNAACESRAEQLQPDFMFCNQHRLPTKATDRWSGSWKWVVYTVNDEPVAFDLLAQGIDMIETDYIGPMLKAWQTRMVAEHGAVGDGAENG